MKTNQGKTDENSVLGDLVFVYLQMDCMHIEM